MGTWVQVMSVWGNGFQIEKIDGPRIFMSEGREDVDITGFEGNIVISLSIVGTSGDIGFTPKASNINGLRAIKQQYLHQKTKYQLWFFRPFQRWSVLFSCPKAGERKPNH